MTDSTSANQISDGELAELRKVRLPAVLLDEMLDDDVPDYLYPLVVVVRMLSNFGVYDNEASNRARALRIIEQARKELGRAELRIIRQNKLDCYPDYDDPESSPELLERLAQALRSHQAGREGVG